MKNIRIDDFSAIKEKRFGEDDLDVTKKRSHINCPINQKFSHQCPICNRLRAVCPFTKMPQCQHRDILLNPQVDISNHSKYNNSTMIGERMKTYSTMESRQINRNPTHLSHTNFSHGTNVTHTGNLSQGRLKKDVSAPQTQEIIFYPVVHNKIVQSTTLTRSPTETPPRRNKNKRFMDVRESMVLTPTQFKSMMESYRHC